ncbi:hypothetical protein [Erwinia sorbitola]|uniref:Uncharacterized protein n=1 Tax=Erwinia sorbitola TaxID=2681984 RepID=A0A6I6EW71_9GAMM|nr:hypothetical protein [Erwinia sorbitola]QGU88593.1 hypothetical protein GN242_15805 [Erwinia sorbitola]
MTRFTQDVHKRVNSDEHQQMIDYLSSEFGEEVSRTVLLLNARLMTTSMSDLKSVVINVTTKDNAQLTLKREGSQIEVKVNHISPEVCA